VTNPSDPHLPLSHKHPIPRNGPFSSTQRIVVRPDRRDQLMRLWAKVRAFDEKEPGTLVQAWHVSVENPNVIWIWELWESEAALESHRVTLRQFRPEMEECILEWPELNICTLAMAKGLPIESSSDSGQPG
jgi:quinol monooxygenase YgiN